MGALPFAIFCMCEICFGGHKPIHTQINFFFFDGTVQQILINFFVCSLKLKVKPLLKSLIISLNTVYHNKRSTFLSDAFSFEGGGGVYLFRNFSHHHRPLCAATMSILHARYSGSVHSLIVFSCLWAAQSLHLLRNGSWPK